MRNRGSLGKGIFGILGGLAMERLSRFGGWSGWSMLVVVRRIEEVGSVGIALDDGRGLGGCLIYPNRQPLPFRCLKRLLPPLP